LNGVDDEHGITEEDNRSVAVDLIGGFRDGRIDTVGHGFYVE